MGTKEIERLMIKVCEALEIVPLERIYLPDDFPENGVDERIVIHVKPLVRGDIFYKGFVEVNIVVPDVEDRAQHDLLDEAEHLMNESFRYDSVGEYEGETYRMGLYSTEVLHEPDAHYHFVNTRLTFEILNI